MCSSRDVPVSSAEPIAAIAPEPGARFREEIREQPDALLRLLETESEFARVGAEMRERGATTIRMVGHGSSDNAASYGVYAFGLLPGWTALRDSISLSVYYGAELDMSGCTALALSQSGRTPDVVEYARARQEPRRLRRRDHERRLVGARRGRRRRARATSRAGARGRGDEDVHESARCARPARRPYDRRRRGIRGRACARSRRRCRSSSSPSSRGSQTSRFRSPMPGACSSSAAEPSSPRRARSR